MYTSQDADRDADRLIKLLSDDSFRRSLIADPHGILIREGIPRDVVDELVAAADGAGASPDRAVNHELLSTPAAAFSTLFDPLETITSSLGMGCAE